MNIVLTLDYELYFGDKTGSISKSIIEATKNLLKVLDEHNIKAVFFVDVGFVKRLESLKSDHPELIDDYKRITDQLIQLSREGHDLQLHVHPHWEDSFYQNGQWEIDASRFKLSDWSQQDVLNIISSYKGYLEGFCANNEVFAFRAGGWCIQPFEKIREALRKHKIWLDSTVFKGGYNDTDTHYFNFKDAPSKSKWIFSSDPLEVEPFGYFMEIPISSYKVSPTFFWKLAISKLVNNAKHETFGDGNPLPASKKWILKKLLEPSHSVVSMDGYKASYLNESFHKKNKQDPNGFFVIIGHPKALTAYSLNRLREFIHKNIYQHNFSTFSNLVNNGIISQPQILQ